MSGPLWGRFNSAGRVRLSPIPPNPPRSLATGTRVSLGSSAAEAIGASHQPEALLPLDRALFDVHLGGRTSRPPCGGHGIWETHRAIGHEPPGRRSVVLVLIQSQEPAPAETVQVGRQGGLPTARQDEGYPEGRSGRRDPFRLLAPSLSPSSEGRPDDHSRACRHEQEGDEECPRVDVANDADQRLRGEEAGEHQRPTERGGSERLHPNQRTRPGIFGSRSIVICPRPLVLDCGSGVCHSRGLSRVLGSVRGLRNFGGLLRRLGRDVPDSRWANDLLGSLGVRRGDYCGRDSRGDRRSTLCRLRWRVPTRVVHLFDPSVLIPEVTTPSSARPERGDLSP